MNRFIQILGAAVSIGQTRLRDKHTWQRELVSQCELLGGVYIKFLQMLATHESTRHLVQGASIDLVYEQVPYEDINIAAELGPTRQKFAKVSLTPFAAGSYGQVYRATLLDGESVIIKVLRPSVRKTLHYDLRLLNTIARIIGLTNKLSILDIQAITQEFSRTTLAETDYKQEARNGEWLRSYYDKRGTLIIPRTFVDIGSPHVLVQQYVSGISLASAMSEQRSGRKIDEAVHAATGSNIWQQLDILGTEYLSAVLYGDYQMVDPHPGNIRLLPDNKVALIDFGMMSAAPRNRSAFVSMIGEMVKTYEDKFDSGAFAVAMLGFLDMELHGALKIVGREQASNYMDLIKEFISDYVRMQASDSLTQHYVLDRQMARLFNQVINRGNKLGIRMSGDNIMLYRSMTMFLSTVRTIGETHDGTVHFKLLHGVMNDVYQTALRHGFTQQPLPEMSHEYAYEVTANWLTVVAEKDRNLYNLIVNRSRA